MLSVMSIRVLPLPLSRLRHECAFVLSACPCRFPVTRGAPGDSANKKTPGNSYTEGILSQLICFFNGKSESPIGPLSDQFRIYFIGLT
jgi:hypothetical protein